MKENLLNENDNYLISTSNDDMDMFYFSQSDAISNRIKDHFKKYQNFLLIFVNPKSGSKQGLTVLEHVNRYRVNSISNFNVVSFPINVKDFSLIKQPKELNDKEYLNKENNIGNNINIKNKIEFDPMVEFSIIVFNIINKEEMSLGKRFIKKYLTDFPEFKIKILIAGGDGTVLGIVEDLNKLNVDLNRCIFGSMPFGTGNDLSNALGFGNECQVGDINDFQKVLFTYLMGDESKIDVWEMSITLDKANGSIYDVIQNGEQIKEDEEKNKILNFKKTFVNYFSLGWDASVGFQFEQRRTSNRCCNKCVYGIEGAKRVFCCKKNYGLTDLLDGFLEGNSNNITADNNNVNILTEKSSDSDIEEVPNEPLINEEKNTLDNNNNIKRFIFKTKTNNQKDIVIKGNPVCIICQNIDFYMGGTRNIWDKTSHLGIQQEEATKEAYREYKRQVYENYQKQAFDDKQIEFFTFERGIEIGLERFARGLAKRVYQGPGPVFLEFKKNPDDNEKIALTKVYVNCDGEYYHLENPTEISVRLNENLCQGQINILRNLKGL